MPTGAIKQPCFVFDFVLSPGGKLGTANLYFFAAGSSMAAPHVSGLAALIVGKFGHMNPSQFRTLIEPSADDILKPTRSPATAGSTHWPLCNSRSLIILFPKAQKAEPQGRFRLLVIWDVRRQARES